MYVKYDRFFTGNGVIFDFGTVSDNSNTDSVLAYNIAANEITDNSRIATPPTVERELTRDSQTQCEVGYACVAGKRLRCDGNGEYSDEVGLKACKIAPAGMKPTSDHKIEPCGAGKFSLGGVSECTDCKDGKFSPQGAAGCTSATSCGALSHSLHCLATTLPKEKVTSDLLHVFEQFLSDIEEVRVGVLKGLAEFLGVLEPKMRESYLHTLTDIFENSSQLNWRMRHIVALQVRALYA